MKGRLAVFKGAHQPIEIREFPLPEVEPGAALVKITLANICGSDMHIWRGDADPGRYSAQAGTSFGHEMTGVVYSLGKDIKTDSMGHPLKEGDRVVYPYFYPCQRCPVCLSHNLAACPNKGRLVNIPLDHPPYFTGAFGDYYYVRPGHFVFKVPDQLSDDMVASVNCAFSQVAFGLHKVGFTFWESIVIQGAGGLGINAVAVARERGASRIIVIDGIEQRLQLAREFGADHTININEYKTHRDRIGKVKELTDGLGADVVAELVGFPAAFAEGISMLRPGGRYLEMGNISESGSVEFIPARLVFGGKTVVALGTYDPWVMPRVLEMMVRTKDKYPYQKLASHKFRLEEINEALNQAEWVNKQPGETVSTRVGIVP